MFLQEGPVNPAEICPLIPPQSGERWRGINSPETDLTRIFLDVKNLAHCKIQGFQPSWNI